MAQQQFERDTIKTSAGDLVITFLGHGSLMMDLAGKNIQVDPYGKVADYAKLPKADLVLVTHGHGDHLDPAALAAIRKDSTVVVTPPSCADKVAGSVVMANGESRTVAGVPVDAVPAYNIAHKRPTGQPFHPKGEGNGYILTFGATRVYLGGDTENTPEMKSLKGIDIAFLPMNLPYTMTPEMVADAARALKPQVVYPYHYGETDCSTLVALLKAEKGIEVRIREMQ